MADLTDKRIAVLATHGFEKSELVVPLETLRGWGADVVVVSPESGEIRSWDDGNWGAATPVDMALSEARADDFDAIVLPGGQMNPDVLRMNPMAVALIRDFYTAGKTIGAICHAPWLLIEAGVAQTGATMTSYPSIRRDVENAGAAWIDEPVVADQGVVTSRKPDDLEAFCAKLREEILEGAHDDRQTLAA
jgi:protease I